MTTFLQVKDNAQTIAPADSLNNTDASITLNSLDTTTFPVVTTGYAVTIWDDVNYQDPGDDPNMEKALVTAADIGVNGSITLLRGQAKAHIDSPRIALLALAQHITDLNNAVLAAEAELAEKAGIDELIRTTRFVVAPFGDTRPADYTCANNTNNEVEINAAITAAAALPNGGIVDLLDGTFFIGARVAPKSNVWLRGQGMFATKIKATAALTAGMIDNKADYDENNPWYNGILSDFELDGTGMNQTTEKKGVNSDTLYNCKIMRLYVHDTTATGIGPDDFYGSTITECIVMNCGFMNKRTITAASWASSVFSFTTATPHGHNVGDTIVISGMTPARYNGKYKVSSTPTSTTFTVDGSNNPGTLTITVNPGAATGFGVISDSLIGHNGIGIASGASYTEATIITNNFCFNNQNNNFLIEADNSNTGPIASYIYSNNVSVSAGQVGYLNTGTPNVQFTNNYDYGSPVGIQAAPVLQNRTITAASWLAGVVSFTVSADHGYTVGERITVTGMTPAAYNGVYIVTSTPTTTSFTAALAADPTAASAFGTSSRVAHSTDSMLIENNIVSDNVLYGIRLPSLADSFIISGNTVRNCFNYGIFVGSSRGNIIDNLIYGNGRDGIDIEVGTGSYNPISRINITGNQIYDNSRYIANYDGIEIQPASTAGISDIIISNNNIYDEQNTKTQRYGIILRTGGNLDRISVAANNLTGNLTGPLLLQNTSENISVTNNTGVNPASRSEMGNVTGATTFDSTTANYFNATLIGNITAVMPTSNVVKGAVMTWILTQDATGGRTLSLPANAVAAGTNQGLVLSTAASVTDIINWVYDGTKWREVSRSLATTKVSSREGITSTGPATSNIVPLTLTQSDTTNNPDTQLVTNSGTGNGIKVNQNGVLASSKYALFIDSSVAQVSAALVRMRQNNASTTQATLQLDNAGSGPALDLVSGNIRTGTTTGSKIGTATNQKLAFYNATPIVQPSATPANATDLATAITLVNDLKAKLVSLGLIA